MLNSKNFKTQRNRFYEYLKNNLATASMAEQATGIKQKCITRYKAELQKSGVLWVVKIAKCKQTGFKAQYLTTNPELKPIDNQLKLGLS